MAKENTQVDVVSVDPISKTYTMIRGSAGCSGITTGYPAKFLMVPWVHGYSVNVLTRATIVILWFIFSLMIAAFFSSHSLCLFCDRWNVIYAIIMLFTPFHASQWCMTEQDSSSFPPYTSPISYSLINSSLTALITLKSNDTFTQMVR